MRRTKTGKRTRLLVVGDRVLIEPDEGEERTEVGLYLPKWAVERESVQGGKIVATGPGTPLPDFGEVDSEPWKPARREARHLPMQAREGDYAIFLRKAAVEIKIDDKNYLVVPQGAILVLMRSSSAE
ncbi:MAG: 10 kDa chaperonin [bacterium]|nr:10 kDa chaperonin [bacterium]MCK6559679.1 co-chaperone GroES family protein [bacterium]NUM65647.1 co-chaperone GroES [candidate division KSB1 bacterium]